MRRRHRKYRSRRKANRRPGRWANRPHNRQQDNTAPPPPLRNTNTIPRARAYLCPTLFYFCAPFLTSTDRLHRPEPYGLTHTQHSAPAPPSVCVCVHSPHSSMPLSDTAAVPLCMRVCVLLQVRAVRDGEGKGGV